MKKYLFAILIFLTAGAAMFSYSTAGLITPESFKQKTGREPKDDDLERANCGKAGQIGHWSCGWCQICDKPVGSAAMTLTIQQRAQRRTKKINNRVARSLPLFAGTPVISQFLTDEATQTEAVMQWDAITERYIKHINEVDHMLTLRAAFMRDQLARLISPDDMQRFDDHLAYLKEKWSAYRTDPAYVADYWRGLLNKAQS